MIKEYFYFNKYSGTGSAIAGANATITDSSSYYEPYFSDYFPKNFTIYYAYANFPNTYAYSKNLGTLGYAQLKIGETSWTKTQVGKGKTLTEDITSYMPTSNYLPTLKISFSCSITFSCGFDKGYVYCIGLPYKFSAASEDASKGTVFIDYQNSRTSSETSVRVIATPKAGYKFSHWSDGSTEQTYNYDPGSSGKNTSKTLTAYFERINYTVNYYNKLLPLEEQLIYSEQCQGAITYQTLEIPNLENIPNGYINPGGWLVDYDFDSEIKHYAKSDSLIIYSSKTDEKSTPFSSFLNLGNEDGAIVNVYFNILPIQYLIYYKSYYGGEINNYTIETATRLFGEKEIILKDLPTPQTGYKLSNKMDFDNGPEDNLKTNYWFVSNENMKPGDETINSISAEYLGDISVYSMEVPINYRVYFHTIDQNNEEIDLEYLDCEYGKSSSVPEILENSIPGYTIIGWCLNLVNTDNLYIDFKTENLIGEEEENILSIFNSNILENYTTEDQSIHHFFSYYIPYGYYINYQWIDSFGKDNEKFNLPGEEIRVYGRNHCKIHTIPYYDEYRVENSGTKKWYYFENDDSSTSQLINEKEIIDAYDLHNYTFYAIKHPFERHITFSSSNELFGEIQVLNKKENDLYEEGDIIQVNVIPKEIAYFSNWSDGNNLPSREILVGSSDQHYTGVFRSNQMYINSLGILAAYKNTEKIKQIIPPKKSQYNVSYTISNNDQYGFYLNNDNYYESNNKGIPNSYALCTINIQSINDCILYIDCINNSENENDFGIISDIDSVLNKNYLVDKDNVKENFKDKSPNDIFTIGYLLPAGSHFIQIKYRKNESIDLNEDSFKFKLRFEPK